MNNTIHTCPSGHGAPCRTPEACLYGCYLDTAEGGRTFDSAIHEAPVRRVPPVRFEPDYGGQRAAVTPWYARVPVIRWAAKVSATLICIAAVAGFVWGAINQFNH